MSVAPLRCEIIPEVVTTPECPAMERGIAKLRPTPLASPNRLEPIDCSIDQTGSPGSYTRLDAARVAGKHRRTDLATWPRRAVSITLVGGTADQLGVKSRFQN